ncbi:hypothetical protein OROHE_002407 [Orobanche hederae]
MDLEAAQPNEISGIQIHKIPVPARRYKPLKEAWVEMYSRIDEEMKIDIRMNHKARRVELKTRPDTPDASNLQRSADFVRALMFGFDVVDAIFILWKDELSVESFQILDVIEPRMRVNVAKAIFAIQNSTRPRIVSHHSTIHILGSLANTRAAIRALATLFF